MDRRSFASTYMIVAGVVLLCWLLAPQQVRADGCYFPEKAVQKMPAIPLQRAILVYKDQTERLIIESTLSAEGQRFGWIVPVPATPTEIRQASPGLMNTLSVFASAEITHDMLDILPTLLILPIIITLWIIYLVLVKPDRRVGTFRYALDVLVGLTLIVLLASIFLPTLGGSGPSSATSAGVGIHVESSQIVGNYEVALLQADTPEALGRWLDGNGFAGLPAQAHAIVSDYIRQSWHFVAAKLQRNGTGPARPHPLSITFPVAAAVYPMRLTSLAGPPVALELFVVSDQQASTDGLSREFCDVLHEIKGKPAKYLAAGKKAEVGHPQSQGILWDGCCLTKLAGTLQPRHMTSDIQLRWGKPSPYQQHLYSRQGAWTIALFVAVGLWTIAAPTGLVVAMRGVPAGIFGKRLFYLRRILGPVVVTCLVLGLSTYLVLPKTEINSIRGRRHRGMFGSDMGKMEVDKALKSKPAESLPAFRQLYSASVDEYVRMLDLLNYVTGEPIREEDSPGNYTIREETDKFVVTWYDHEMDADVATFPKQPSSTAAN